MKRRRRLATWSRWYAVGTAVAGALTLATTQLAGQHNDPSRPKRHADGTAGAGGGRSEVFLRAQLSDGQAARVFVGDGYSLGADQVDAIATIRGLTIHKFERMDVKADGYRTRTRRSGMRLVG